MEPKELPWHGLPSIYAHIASNLDGDGRLTESACTLPDQERRYEGEQLRWAAGAMDGAFGHHGGAGGDEQQVTQVVNLVKAIAEKNTLPAKVELYKILAQDKLMDFIDPVLEKMIDARVRVYPYLYDYAQWLAFESPDRGAVKFGIALLGCVRGGDNLDKIVTLGKHEEFTLFSAVAITNMQEDPEQTLWALAKCVDGWGRIHLVERLAETQAPAIKEWLLREGYRNSVMYEYLAYTCAVAGDLRGELLKPQVTDQVLEAAGDIIGALINGGPAESMDNYDDGAEVTRLYVAHLEKRAGTLDHFLRLSSIREFLEDEHEDTDWAAREKAGWTANVRTDLLIDLHAVLSDPKWPQMVLAGQHVTDYGEFWQVDQAAHILGISLWDTHWRRLTEDSSDATHWYNVMKNANDERIDQIISLAMRELPLDAIASGAADELGLGKEYNAHSCLDHVLQDLGDYPGKGFALVSAGLQSPVTRNRNMAIRALAAWGADRWPAGTRERLAQAAQQEPNKDTKTNLDNLLAGRAIA